MLDNLNELPANKWRITIEYGDFNPISSMIDDGNPNKATYLVDSLLILGLNTIHNESILFSGYPNRSTSDPLGFLVWINQILIFVLNQTLSALERGVFSGLIIFVGEHIRRIMKYKQAEQNQQDGNKNNPEDYGFSVN